MIRPATLDDVPQLIAFVVRCYDSMHWKEHGLVPDLESVTRTLCELTRPNPDVLFAVIEVDSQIVGACAAVIAPHPWSRSAKVAQEWIWHILPDFPDGHKKRSYFVKLLDIMLEWARQRGATAFKACTAKQYPAVQELLERRGIRAMETVCVGGL